MLKQALKCFIDEEDVDELSNVLILACKKRKILFKEVVNILGSQDRGKEILSLAYEWRLLIPTRSFRNLQWNDCLIVFEENETFKILDVVKALVNEALRSGRWSPDRAIYSILKDQEDSHLYVKLVKLLVKRNVGGYVDAIQIKQECEYVGIKKDKVDFIIALFKSIGIFSPSLGYIPTTLLRIGPIYELNPSLIFC